MNPEPILCDICRKPVESRDAALKITDSSTDCVLRNLPDPLLWKAPDHAPRALGVVHRGKCERLFDDIAAILGKRAERVLPVLPLLDAACHSRRSHRPTLYAPWDDAMERTLNQFLRPEKGAHRGSF